MPIPPVIAGDGLPDRCWMMVECGLGICIYYNQIRTAGNIITAFDPFAVLDFVSYNPRLPTSFLIWHTGRQYNVVIAGSQNVTTVNAYIARSLDTRPPGWNTYINSFVWTVHNLIAPLIASHLPTDPTSYELWISGHSLGAAVGQILAIEYGAVLGFENVHFLGFGSPKVVTEDFHGETPADWAIVQNVLDPVPYRPSPYFITAALQTSIGRLVSRVVLVWTTIEPVFRIYASGLIEEAQPDSFRVAGIESYLILGASNHFLAAYLEAILAAWEKDGTSDACSGLVPMMRELVFDAYLDERWPQGHPEQYVDFRTVNADNFRGWTPPPVTLGNVPQTVLSWAQVTGFVTSAVGSLVVVQPGAALTRRGKSMYLRGVPDRVIAGSSGPRVSSDGVYLNALTTFLRDVLNSGWGWVAVDDPPRLSGEVISFQLFADPVTKTRNIRFWSSQAQSLAAGDTIRLTGAHTRPELRGHLQVLRVDPDDGVTAVTDLEDLIILSGSLWWELVTQSFADAGAAAVQRDTTRLTGRGRAEGRRKAR